MKVVITFRTSDGRIAAWNTTEADLESTLEKFAIKDLDVIDWEYV